MSDEKNATELDLGEPIRNLAGGQYVFNRYSLVKLVARGRNSAVWQAWDDQQNREVALKFLPLSITSDAAALTQLQTVVDTVKDLALPQTIKVYGLEKEEKLAAVAMEHVEATSLHELRGRKKNQVFEAADLREWIKQLCAALGASHAKTGTAHGAIKPSNLLVDAKGSLLISDFGIDRKLGELINRAEPNKDPGHTLRYCSPQSTKGEAPVQGDDVYAVGVLLHELITGKPPFVIGNILAQVNEDVPPPMTRRRRDMRIIGEPIPRAWDETAAACLAKEPEKRPASMEQLADMLELTVPKGDPAKPLAAARPMAVPQPAISPAIAAGAAPAKSGSPSSKALLPIAAIVISAVIGIAGFVLSEKAGNKKAGGASNTTQVAEARVPDQDSQSIETARWEAEAKRRTAEEEAKRLTAEVEARKKAEATLLAAAEKAKLEADSQRKTAEAEAKRLAAEIEKSKQMEAKRIAAEEIARKANEEAQRKALEDARRNSSDAASIAAAEKAKAEANAKIKAAEDEAKRLTAELAARRQVEEQLKAAVAKAKTEADTKAASAIADAKRLTVSEESRKVAEARLSEQRELERRRKLEDAARLLEMEERQKRLALASTTAKAGDTKAAADAKAAQDEEARLLAGTLIRVEKPVLGRPWFNTLGMRFVPVGNTLFGVWECRRLDFDVFVTAARYNAGPGWKNPNFTQTENHPVVNVSFIDAQAFCNWLTDKERKEGLLPNDLAYRLPNDQEWSMAVGLTGESGGTPVERSDRIRGQYPWGTAWPPPVGSGNYDANLGTDRFEATSPVGSFPANRQGIYDLGGNVWEWLDEWNDSTKTMRTLRGASWFGSVPGSLLTSHRTSLAPVERRFDNGFRVVLAR